MPPVAETNGRKRKALWWGDGAKPHIPKMLRHLFLEMFGLCLTAPLCSEKENWKNREEKRGEVRYKREGATKKDRLTAAVHVDLY